MQQTDLPRVKCYALLNLNTTQLTSNQKKAPLVSLVAQNPIFLQDLLQEAETLFQTIVAFQKKENNFEKPYAAIQKIYSQSGVWYCTIRQSVLIGLLVTTQYPVSGAMRLLRKIENIVKLKLSPINTKELISMEPIIRAQLNDYDRDPYTDDVLEITAKSVDSIQGQMEDNIRKIQENHLTLEVVHHKSADVAQVAGLFSKQAKDLKQKTQMQQYLLYGFVGLVVIGVTSYLLYEIL